MAVGLVDLLEGSRYYPVYSSLLSELDSLSIVRLSKTCRRLATLYRDAMPREWDVDRVLRRFVEDPRALRKLMRDRRVVISGELALQFFERSRLIDRMDMFVDEGDGAVALSSYLVDTEGYKALPPSVEDRFIEAGGRVSSIVDRMMRS
jgi:hypothetical protein